jgi:sugar phosphate isomerase/epimerase
MTKLAVSEMTTYRWSFEEDVRNYQQAGIGAIGVWRQKLSDFGEEKGCELLEEAGLEVSSVLWAGGFTGSDGRSYRESVLDAQDAIRIAGRLGAECLLVYTGARAGHTHNHARRLFRGAIKDLLPFTGEFGVKLAIEPMHEGCASDWTFLTSLDETLSLLDELDDAALKLAFDTYHFAHDRAILEKLPELAPRIGVVHLGDAKAPPTGEQNRCRLGEGQLALAEIVSVLQRSDYDGYFEVELMGEEIEVSDYADLISHSKQTVENWAAVAGRS